MAEAYGVRGIPPSHGPGRIRDFVQGGGLKKCSFQEEVEEELRKGWGL